MEIFAKQLPPGAPLAEAFQLLLGKEVGRWDDAGVPSLEQHNQIILKQCVETMLRQLRKMSKAFLEPADCSNYGASVAAMKADSLTIKPY